MKVRNQEAWDKWKASNQDGYGKACVTYAERWADLMEKRIMDIDGSRLEDIAKQASHDADTEGITGFMYGAAVSMLAQAWEHGETLRRWHNLDTQIGNEGAEANEKGSTLNPALLCLCDTPTPAGE